MTTNFKMGQKPRFTIAKVSQTISITNNSDNYFWQCEYRTMHSTFLFLSFLHAGPQLCNWPVIAWLESMTRLEPQFLVTLTRLESRWGRWWLDSSHVFHRMTRLDSSHNQWLEARVRIIFAKSQSLWSTNPVCLHTKKWSLFGPVMIKIGANFLFWLSSRVILYPKGQVFITCTEVDLRFAFHWGARRAQYRPYWHSIMIQSGICISW